MRADDGCIDHLQSRVTHSASSECLQDHIPQAAVGPPTELTKDRIPVAKFLRQIAPGRAGSHQPKHRVEHAAMIARWSATTPYQERLEIRPLIVGHQSANHGRSPQRAALNQFAIPASIDLSTRPSRAEHNLFRPRTVSDDHLVVLKAFHVLAFHVVFASRFLEAFLGLRFARIVVATLPACGAPQTDLPPFAPQD